MHVYLACIYVSHVHAWGLWRTEGDIGCPGSRIRVLMSHHEGGGDQTPVFCKNWCCKNAKLSPVPSLFVTLCLSLCVCVYVFKSLLHLPENMQYLSF